MGIDLALLFGALFCAVSIAFEFHYNRAFAINFFALLVCLSGMVFVCVRLINANMGIN